MKLKIPPPPKSFNPNPDKFETGKFKDEKILICRETFLIAYKDKQEFSKRMERFFPGFTSTKSWQCIHCGRWHFTGLFLGSSGDSCSQEKTLIDKNFKYPPPPKNWKPHFYKTKPQAERNLF